MELSHHGNKAIPQQQGYHPPWGDTSQENESPKPEHQMKCTCNTSAMQMHRFFMQMHTTSMQMHYKWSANVMQMHLGYFTSLQMHQNTMQMHQFFMQMHCFCKT